MELSRKALGIKFSSTLAITAKANELKSKGLDVVSFSAGEPDFDTPEHIKAAAIKAINDGFTKYTPASGIIELKKAVCAKFKKDNGISYEPSQIVISNGAKQALQIGLMTILNDGDEVIIPAPYWVSYSEMVKIAGGTPVIIYTRKGNNFSPTPDDFKKAYTNKTKAIIITSPSNPTGAMLSGEDLLQIAEFAVSKDLIVISDEIYEKLIYDDNKKHISIASLNDEIYKRTIVVNGVSKSYSMTGWRIGYSASSAEIAKIMGSLQSHISGNPNSIAQKAAVEAILGDQSCVLEMKKEFGKRREYIYQRVLDTPGLSVLKPEGAFYLFVDVSGIYGKKYNGKEINSAAELAAILIEEKMVALVPCDDFGMPDHVRLSYATSMETIKKGMDRIAELISQLA
ncbi:MAG: pyridoxal phosphate-dependent aminotransferase [Lachnospiraceae bacterium]|nr:pyridoxal phosphate-dependent aminotransferase [Lachnospiraceae bacterium]